MSNPEYFGGELPFNAADELAYDLASLVYDGHVAADEAVAATVLEHDPWTIFDVDHGESTISVFPDDVSPDLAVGVDVRTPLMPDGFGPELLAHDTLFYVDQLAAMVCGHLFGLDTVRRMGDVSPGMIAIRLDIMQLAAEIATARQLFAASGYSGTRTILRLPTSPTYGVVLERTKRLPDMFGFSMHSSKIVFEHREHSVDA